MKKVESEKTGKPCPKCGKPLVYRYSKRTGIQFIGCSDFPKCKYAEFPNSPRRILEDKCPICGKNLIERTNRRGQLFVGCSGYPKCHYIRKTDKDGNILPPTITPATKAGFKKTKAIKKIKTPTKRKVAKKSAN
jgi:DNA topoisomerase-1